MYDRNHGHDTTSNPFRKTATVRGMQSMSEKINFTRQRLIDLAYMCGAKLASLPYNSAKMVTILASEGKVIPLDWEQLAFVIRGGLIFSGYS